MNISQFLKVICLTVVCALGATDLFAMREKREWNRWQRVGPKSTKLKKTENHFFAVTGSREAGSDVKQAIGPEAEETDLSDCFNDLSLDTQDEDEDEVKDSQPVIEKRGLLRLLMAREMGKQVPQQKILKKLDDKVVQEHYRTVRENYKAVIKGRYKDYGFMIGDWTCYLEPDEVREVVAWLGQKAKEFVGEKSADQQALQGRFRNLPENCFKMLVRYEYRNLHLHKIDDVVPIIGYSNEVRDAFWTFGVRWVDCNISSLAIYSDVLAVMNSIFPITGLYLGGNKIKRTKGLEKLKKLKVLSLSHNRLTKIKGLENFPELEELYLFGNPITRIEGLDRLPCLRELGFDDNPKLQNQEGFQEITDQLRARGVTVTIDRKEA